MQLWYQLQDNGVGEANPAWLGLVEERIVKGQSRLVSNGLGVTFKVIPQQCLVILARNCLKLFKLTLVTPTLFNIYELF